MKQYLSGSTKDANKTTETSVGDVLLPRQITSVLELNHVALCLICDLCSVDLNTSAEQVVGMHDEAIKCVEYSPQSGRIFLLMLVITKLRDIIICSMLKDLCHVGNDN